MARESWGKLAVALLSLWVLAAHVQGDFGAVRIKLVQTPLAPAQQISLPLTGAAAIPDPQLVLVYRIRNTGAAPVTVAASRGGQIVRRSTIPAGTSRRVDLSWPRTAEGGTDRLELHGTSAQWTLEYAELANLHGFTRGAVEFTIVPDSQPLTRAPIWVLGAWIVAAIVIGIGSPAGWGRRWTIAHMVPAGVVILFFGAVALAPLVSGFRVVLASHTFAAFLAVLAARHLIGSVRWVRQWLLAALAASAGLASSIGSVAAVVPWRRVMLLGAVVAYAAMLWFRVGAYAGGSDQSGYLHSARLLTEGRVSTPRPMVDDIPRTASPHLFTPLGFRTNESGDLTPTYPIGLPLTIAAVAQATGWQPAPDVTMVLYAVAGVILIFRFARVCGLSPEVAALAGLLLATSPLYLLMALTLMSDLPALVWTTAAVLLAWHSRERAVWALAAGAAVSLAVLVRPANAVVFIPVAICLGPSATRWLLLGAGGAPGALALVVYNAVAYGSVLSTGYDSDEIRGLFSAGHVGAALRHYARWLPVVLTPIGVFAAAFPVVRARTALPGRVLGAWAASFLLFYAFYSHTHDLWWMLRFVLPAFPPLIVASLWAGRVVLERWNVLRSPVAARLLPVVAALLIVAHNAWWATSLHVLTAGRGERRYYDVAEWTRAHLPPGASVVAMQASGALFYYTDFPIVRWDFLEGETLRHLAGEAAAGRQPLYAVLFAYELELQGFRDRMPLGPWVQVGSIDDVTIWRFDGFTDDIRAAASVR